MDIIPGRPSYRSLLRSNKPQDRISRLLDSDKNSANRVLQRQDSIREYIDNVENYTIVNNSEAKENNLKNEDIPMPTQDSTVNKPDFVLESDLKPSFTPLSAIEKIYKRTLI